MRLLVAFDGSEGAHLALREAASLARETGAAVSLLRVLNPLLDAADVVAMEVRDQQIVDLLEAGLLRGGVDALSIAVIGRGVAGVDKQRLAGG